VASGSPISEDVAALRMVRDGFLRTSEVGFAFFESLHYDYYAFSPQVCNLMARHPQLRPLVLDGLVRPLVTVLRLIEQFTRGPEVTDLGERFAAEHADREAAMLRYQELRRAQAGLEGSEARLSGLERELVELLRPGLTSEHVAWAILEPIQIYQRALRSYLDGENHEALGQQLHDAICTWAPLMPLDNFWPALDRQGLSAELAVLDSLLLRTDAARVSFRDRLKREFGMVTAMAAMAGGVPQNAGANE
jgi:hypothetical protein